MCISSYNNLSDNNCITIPYIVSHYVASKHALEGMTVALRIELAPWGISVANICPGFMKWVTPSFLSSFPPSLLPSFFPSFIPSFFPSFLSSSLPFFLPSFLPSFLSCHYMLYHVMMFNVVSVIFCHVMIEGEWCFQMYNRLRPLDSHCLYVRQHEPV